MKGMILVLESILNKIEIEHVIYIIVSRFVQRIIDFVYLAIIDVIFTQHYNKSDLLISETFSIIK